MDGDSTLTYCNNTIRNNHFYDTEYPINVQKACDSKITHNLLRGYKWGMIIGAGEDVHTLIENNTLDGNDAWLYGMGFTDHSSGTIRNTIAVGHTSGGVYNGSGGDVHVDHYLSYENAINNDLTGVETDTLRAVFSPPFFRGNFPSQYDSLDYHLFTGISSPSPALDLGDSTRTDSTGGSRIDLGRYGGTSDAGTAPGSIAKEDYFVTGDITGWPKAVGTQGTWRDTSVSGHYLVDNVTGESCSYTTLGTSGLSAYIIETRLRFSGHEGRVMFSHADTSVDYRVDLMAPSDKVRLIIPGISVDSDSTRIDTDTWYAVRIHVREDSVRVFLDGELMIDWYDLGDFTPDGKVGIGSSSVASAHAAQFDYFLVLNAGDGTGGAGKRVAPSAVPLVYALHPNYPNPFNPETMIRYSLPEGKEVELEIFDILGQKVHTLVDAWQPPGRHQMVWNGRDRNGHSVASGVYFCRFLTDEYVTTQKMLLLR